MLPASQHSISRNRERYECTPPPAARMKLRHRSLIAFLVVTVFTAGCSERKADSAPTSADSTTATIAAPVTDAWVGQWTGPEGTFLRIAGAHGEYEITIQNLDGPSRYQGNAVDGQIQFERNGTKESIHPTNGADTGMKWLAEKSNCLTIRAGEGYCRD